MTADDHALMLVTDQLPWPPRNGITLPLFHYIEQLRQTHRVRLCLLQGEGAEDQTPWLADNTARYGPIVRLALARRSKPLRALAELAGREMLQHGWVANEPWLLASEDVQQVLVAPISAVAKWRAVRRAQPALQPRVTVAAVNDCTAAEYHYRARGSTPGSALAHVKARLDGLRAPRIAGIEAALLADCNAILLQTEADLLAMRELVGDSTARRCLLAPNGVRDEFLALLPQRREQVLFVAELSGEYAPVTDWLCTQVWPLVRAARAGAQLLVVGRGASPALQRRMATTAGVTHLSFAPDLLPVYAAAGVVWSPVFKGFGLINKTLEAMAAALPVVGGHAAFNGIPGFVDGVHGVGLPAPVATAFAEATVRLLAAGDQSRQIGEAARELVRGNFRWSRTAEVLRQALRAPPVAAPVVRATHTALAGGG
ncbi:MAG: glycosyltransferase family 4 protein [Rubrivivax sp.]|nr:glycosyltransferase family 4 protein [Rubrivivax sp.]